MPTFILVAALLSVCLPAPAQSANPSPATPSAAEIVEKFLAATGGVAARRSLQSIILGGDFTYNSNTADHPLGSYTYSYKAPSSDVLNVSATSHGVSWTGHRAGEPFKRVTIDGLGTIDGVDTAIVEQDLYSLLEWDFSRGYNGMEVMGRTRVENRWAYAVEFTTKQKVPLVRYYDTETFLLLRMDQEQRVPGSKNQPDAAYRIETSFSDYRDYGALRLPQLVTINRPVRKLVFKIGKPKLNPQIADSVFR